MILMFGFSWGTALKLHVAAEVDFIWGAACLTLTSSCAAVRGKSRGYWSQWGKLKGTVKSRNLRVERLIQKEINRESTISTNPWFSEHLPCKMLNCNWVVFFSWIHAYPYRIHTLILQLTIVPRPGSICRGTRSKYSGKAAAGATVGQWEVVYS